MSRLSLFIALICIVLAQAAFGGVYWPEPTMLQANTGRYSSLEAGPNGTLHLAFYDYINDDLRYAVRSASGQWTFETVDSAGIVGWFASLELDQAGVPHIAYCEAYNYKLKYAVRNGPNDWTIEVVDSAPGRGWYSSLALDSAGNPHIAYSGNWEWDLRHAWYVPGSGWQFEVIDSVGDVGLYCALDLTSSDLCRISYFDATNKRLKFAWQQPGGGWLKDIVDSSGDAGIDTAMTLDDQGHPHIAYWDRGNDASKYAWHDGVSWHTEIVELTPDGGYEAGIVYWQGSPRISYEGTCGVRYAEKLAGGWRIYQVDRTGHKCGDTALALEGTGHPRITYLNLGDGSLYYAEGTDSSLPDAPVPEQLSKIADVRARPDGSWVSIGGQVLSASGPVSGHYVECPDRCAGICTIFPEYSIMPLEGRELHIVGVVETKAGPERALRVCDWWSTGSPGVPRPLFMRLRDLKAAAPTSPLSSLGLLVQAAGRIISVGQGYVVLDDGSPPAAEQGIQVMLGAGWTVPQQDDMVVVTGIAAIQAVGSEFKPVLLPRRSEDVVIIPN